LADTKINSLSALVHRPFGQRHRDTPAANDAVVPADPKATAAHVRNQQGNPESDEEINGASTNAMMMETLTTEC
jgi:hypothetical protein